MSIATLSLAAILMSACTAADGDPRAGPTGSGSGSPSATPSAGAITGGPGPSATPPPNQRTATTSPRDDRQGDLVRRQRTLTGTVARRAGCTTLDTGDALWQLTGPIADRLTPGDRVTVVGELHRGATGCSTIALEVATVRPA